MSVPSTSALYLHQHSADDGHLKPDVSSPPAGGGLVPPGMPRIERVGPIVHRAHVNELSLALSSMDIGHSVERESDGFYIVVALPEALRARRILRDYIVENRDWPPLPASEDVLYARSNAGAVVVALLAMFFVITGPVDAYSRWFSAGTAVSQRVLHGEPWRAVTALTLHADAMHLLGNVAAGLAFLPAVTRRLGAGRGIFFTIVGGVLGNLANAFFHAHMLGLHRSIGASTAIFSAVGVLAATQVVADSARGARRWRDLAMPIVGSLALLGMLGSSPQADLWAHFFGLLGGVIAGFAASRTIPSRRDVDSAHQVHYAAASVLVVLGSWVTALLAGRSSL